MPLFRHALLVLLPFLAGCFSYSAFAAIRLPSFFGDSMVLQQKTDAAIWGWSGAGSTVRITTSWNGRKYSTRADAAGYWKLAVATPAAGGPFSITLSDGLPVTLKNVLIGEVWLCSGQSNMEMPMKGFKDQPILGSNEAIFQSANPQIRLYTIPRSVQRQPLDTSKTSFWKTAQPATVSNFSATAYFFARILQQQLKVPVALINLSYGGSPAEAFMSREALLPFSSIAVPAANGTDKLSNKNATTLYNGMVHPFVGYTIRGCLWYQGETNYDRPDEYEKLFPAMVAQWRSEWGQGNFPFYFAQIAPYNYSTFSNGAVPEKSNSAYLRDAQRKAADLIPNSGLVVLLDIGEEKNIHPADKETGGKRFAYMALAHTYGYTGFAFQSPAPDSLQVKGNIATLRFRHAPNGLTSYSQPLTLFEIAGADKVFYPAQAVISKGELVLSSPQVAAPVAVRYAFRDFVKAQLFNTEGYPVSSFRTDNW